MLPGRLIKFSNMMAGLYVLQEESTIVRMVLMLRALYSSLLFVRRVASESLTKLNEDEVPIFRIATPYSELQFLELKHHQLISVCWF